uniref:Uncharacterized protein n=1 Tax=Lactuca sativa TaxID=4236 RepID=A0A9R1V9M6_LACSA|nr:hypothetical protein LSAT_V11C600333670 [Lactuca sativa]
MSYCLRQVSQPHFYSLYLVQNQLDLNSLIFRSLGVPYLCRINRVIKGRRENKGFQEQVVTKSFETSVFYYLEAGANIIITS